MATMRCEWFAKCTNKTSKALPHPILKFVPCCDRCAGLSGEPEKLVDLGAAFDAS